MGTLGRRLRRNIGGVTKILLTDLLWRPKNLLTTGGVAAGVTQVYIGAELLLAGSPLASLTALLLGAGAFAAGAISFFDRPVTGGIAFAVVLAVVVTGPGAAFGAVDTAHDTAVSTLQTGETESNAAGNADDQPPDGDSSARVVTGDGDTAADGCGTNDGDPSYNEDNDRDNDGRCDE